MNLSEVFKDPQVLHQEMLLEIKHPGYGLVKMTGFPLKLGSTKCKVRLPAPKLGEHTVEILKSLSLDVEAVKNLKEKGII